MAVPQPTLAVASSQRLRVATPVFEGPLELLLALVEREDVDILQVPLADLTHAYREEVALREEVDPGELAEFLWLLARLLLWKSIRLLPTPAEEPEEAELLDWEEAIRERLEEYRLYRRLAEELMERAAQEPFAYSPPGRPVAFEGQEAPLDLGQLVNALQRVLERIPPRPLLFEGRRWTLEQKLDLLGERVARGAVDLVEMLLECEDRFEAVLTFVALLELLRQGKVRVRQRESFGAIFVVAA